MVQFFVEGGWGMYPVLIMGLLLIGASVRYALDGEPVRLRFIAVLGITLTITMLHATWTCVAAVLRYLQTLPPAEVTRTLIIGLMESTRPATLGGALLVLALIAVSIGAYRAGRRETTALR